MRVRKDGETDMEINPDEYRARPGKRIALSEIDPESTGSFSGGKEEAKEILADLSTKLRDLQERLYAEHQRAVLIVLQGMDTCGKDGAIEHVFSGVNPAGVRVANFKVPTPEEASHDFLWRVHKQTPARGEIVIYNRSHYEDVLIVRVHELVGEKVWRKRYRHIKDFERVLVDEGAIILKFFLHISKEEQKERLLDRLQEVEKRWKFNPNDIKERELWDDYMKAYEDAISATTTAQAPWYIVPANRKWFRNLVIASTLVKTLKDLDPQPPVTMDESEISELQAALEEG